jgi:hypothetical protein
MSKRGKIVYQDLKPIVNDDGRLYEIDTVYPPITNDRQIILYVDDLTLNNDGVTSDMKVDGSVTTQEFSVNADNEFDIFINSVSFFIAAENVVTDLGEFAGIVTPLTNGCQLIYENSDEGDIIIGDNLQTNYDLLRMCNMNPQFGLVSNAAFKIVQAFSNQDDGYLFILKFSDYGYEQEYSGGIRLKAGTTDRLVFKIRDDLNLTPSEISSFDGRVYGFKRRFN